jgi:DNA-binding CsgD family transcriptional regulator
MDRRGRTYENIARRLGTSYNTVKNQRASILRKLDADSVVNVVRMVAEHEKG